MEWRGYFLPIDFLLIKDVSKNRRYLGFSKQRRTLNGRDADNESKRTGQIADH